MHVGGVQWILSLGEHVGGQRRALLARAGICEDALQTLDARIPRSQSLALWRAIAEHISDPTLPVRYGQRARPEALGILGYLITHVGSLGQLLERVEHFQKLTQSGAPIRLERGRDSVIIAQRLMPEEVALRYPPEFVISSFVALLRHAIAIPWRPLEVFLQHPEVPWADTCERVFACPVRFSAADSGVVIAAEDLDIPINRHDPNLLAYLTETATRYLDVPPRVEPLATIVLRTLADSPGDKVPTLAHVSCTLGLGPRTLQRRLRAEGYRFRDLRDAVFSERARRLLSDPFTPVADIATSLGYDDPGAFTRAFQRWTGMSPRAFRRARGLSPTAKNESPTTLFTLAATSDHRNGVS
ncbi:MAG: AraC family transcriptional regulator [Haliangiales bacterium]